MNKTSESGLDRAINAIETAVEVMFALIAVAGFVAVVVSVVL